MVAIGYGILPDASASTYVNDAPYEFSINYPNGWIVYDSPNFYDDGIIFSDKEEWTTNIYVNYYDNVGDQLSDNEEIEILIDFEKKYCDELDIRTDGMMCYDFQMYDESTMVYEIDDYRAITIFYSYTMQHSDYSGEFPMIGSTTDIYVGNDIWEIVSESDDYVFEKYHDTIAETVTSFKLGSTAQSSSSTFIPSSNTSYKIYFEELPEWAEFDINSAVRDATDYWKNRDGITFSRTYNVNDADMYVSWIKNYGHNVLGTYLVGNIEVGLGDDLCGGNWMPFSQQTTSETLIHEIGHHLGYDDIEYSPDTTDIMAYSNSKVIYEYEKWSENTMVGYGNYYPLCTYDNGVTYDYRLVSNSNHRYDVFFVPSVNEFDKYMDGYDFRSSCSKYDAKNTQGSCKTNPEGGVVVFVSGGSTDSLAQYELTLSQTDLPSASTPVALPPITKNETPLIQNTPQTITTSDKFFSAHENDFTTITISGYVPEQFLNNRYPAYLTITHEGVVIDELKVRITEQGKFYVPFQLAPNSPHGTYLISGKSSLGSFGTTTFNYGTTPVVVPPSVYSTITNEQTQSSSSKFNEFLSNQYGFSIDYPSSWIYEENYDCYDEDGVCMFSFSDNLDYWSVQVNVNLFDDVLSDYSYANDRQYLDDMDVLFKDECQNSREYGYDYDCTDYILHKLDTKSINGMKAYEIEFSSTYTYDDDTYEQVRGISTEIPVGNDLWQIYSEVIDEYAEYNLPLIEHSISSFSLASYAQPVTTQEITCGAGTTLKDGKCEIIQNTIPQTGSSDGGGCLIATAAYGSEMAPQVQFLRELRDNTVLQTTSGTAFMNGFNQFYYSFSPQIANYERENPVFKEMVKVSLTPLLTSLTLLNYVEIDSEEEMLGYGIGIILLNVGVYFVAPAIIIISIRKRFHSIEK